MKTLYIECAMGAAGDMLTGALLELSGDREGFLRRMNSLGLDGVQADAAPSVKCGITGTHFSVRIGGAEDESIDVPAESLGHSHENDHDHRHEHAQGLPDDHHYHHGHTHEHSHVSLGDIAGRIGSLPLPECVKARAVSVYTLLAEAEAAVHGRPVTDVHFHEVGSLDAVTDIVGACLLMEELAPDEVIVSPVNVGNGFVRCAHGVLPVPAPATALLLRDVPVYGGKPGIGELCTPTGAALLRHFADRFGPMPPMRVQRIGYGMGKKDFEACNCVRAFLGETESGSGGPNGLVAELRCNIDDMTGEELGYARRLLLREGAKDVFTVPADMKKDRPGVLLICICDTAEADRFASLLLRHTTTFGVRKTVCERYMLRRELRAVDTPWGDVRVKRGDGFGAEKAKPEYEDVAAAAERAGIPFSRVESYVLTKLNDNLK